MLDLSKNPTYCYMICDSISNDEETPVKEIVKFHITRIGKYNRVLACPSTVTPGRSCSWYINSDNVFETKEQAKAELTRLYGQ